jgi:hypothetical protein
MSNLNVNKTGRIIEKTHKHYGAIIKIEKYIPYIKEYEVYIIKSPIKDYVSLVPINIPISSIHIEIWKEDNCFTRKGIIPEKEVLISLYPKNTHEKILWERYINFYLLEELNEKNKEIKKLKEKIDINDISFSEIKIDNLISVKEMQRIQAQRTEIKNLNSQLKKSRISEKKAVKKYEWIISKLNFFVDDFSIKWPRIELAEKNFQEHQKTKFRDYFFTLLREILNSKT